MLPPEPASQPESPSPSPSSLLYLPFGAYAAPSAITAPVPALARTYELPTARGVVSAGLQLAQGSSAAVRRASIYIGLLSLGAFGPVAILILVGLAKLLADPTTANTLRNQPLAIFAEQPDLAGPLTVVYIAGVIGLVLIIAIGIDAGAIAISILGGAASGRQLRLQEAIARARQTFWRLVGAGVLVGLGAGLLALALQWPFLRRFDSNQGVSFIASMIATLVFSPFAFASTGIVLGNAGAIETLRRSVRLFRAKPRIALVVTLFALVTAAIQSFAFSSGADIAIRVADFFHLGGGSSSLILPGILILALIVAFGSLTFTIAAIVSAPQVAAFLGLTFYSAGLDLARDPAHASPRRVRWVSVPMAIVMAGLGATVILGIPTIANFHARERSPLATILRHEADANGQQLAVFGPESMIEDPANDLQGASGGTASSDIRIADVGWIGEVPDWLLASFDCSSAAVACGSGEPQGKSFSDGAYVFFERVAADPATLAADRTAEWGPILDVGTALRASGYRGLQYPGASHAFVTRRQAGHDTLVLVRYTTQARFEEATTSARSRWFGADLVTIIPAAELGDASPSWDAYAADRAVGATTGAGTSAGWSYDFLRRSGTEPLRQMDLPTMFKVLPTFRP